MRIQTVQAHDNKVSVVTATYNSSNSINSFLQGLGKNEHMINEVVIIENNSPEKKKTQEAIRKYSKVLDGRVKFIANNENEGFARACNQGAGLSKSNYILFLNPDTELKKNSLNILLKHSLKTNADVTGGKAVNYQNQPHGSVVRNPGLFVGLFEFTNLGKLLNITKAHQEFYYEDISILNSKIDKKVDAVSGAYLLVKKKSFETLGGFDEKFFMYLEDVDLGKRANNISMKVIFCPHSVIWHIGGASSKNKYRIRHQAWFDSRKYYFRKHFGLFTNLIIQPIFMIEEILLKLIKKP